VKEISIDTRSWHYWFANLGDGANTNDFCAYIRSVIGGIFMCLFGLLIVSLYIGITGLAIGWLLAVIFNGYIEPEAAMPGIIINGGLLLGVPAVVFFIKARENISENSFARNVYTSFKDKLCFKVTLK